MLVLSNGEHLLFGETAKGHAVLKGNHVYHHAVLHGVKDVHERAV